MLNVTGETLDTLPPPTAPVDMGSQPLQNVSDPTDPQDAATKNYVDEIRVVTVLSDATSITPQASGASNINIQDNTQLAGTLTINAPSATAEARGLVLRIKCTNAQTLSFNSIYRAPSLLPLPTGISAGKTDYMAFAYNNTDLKWDLTAVMKEY